MALLLCPSCKEVGFFYVEDNDENGIPFTRWGCMLCHYIAYEEIGMARACQYCQIGEESLLEEEEDERRRYWWCYRCNRTTPIELINPI